MKTNRNGRECPAWCIRAHQDENESWGCAGTGRNIPGSRGGADARLGIYDETPEVAAWLFDGPAAALATAYADAPHRADALARFLEFAAQAPEADLRALAGKVREAAAEAWPAPDAETAAGRPAAELAEPEPEAGA